MISVGGKAASSDAAGKYIMRGIPRGITVTVQADGYLTATYTFVETETKKVALTANSLTGKVTDGETGAPVVGITLHEGARSVQVDAQGRYSLTKVTKSAVISVTADGYLPARQPVSGRSTLDLALQPNQISGLVTDIKTGKPIITATVYLDGKSTPTDAQGRYTFKRVKYGATVTASADGYGPAGGEIGESPTLDLALKPGVLSGIVKDAITGAPIAGATVAVNGDYVTTDANGVYKLGDVPPGATITAKYPGYGLARVHGGHGRLPQHRAAALRRQGDLPAVRHGDRRWRKEGARAHRRHAALRPQYHRGGRQGRHPRRRGAADLQERQRHGRPHRFHPLQFHGDPGSAGLCQGTQHLHHRPRHGLQGRPHRQGRARDGHQAAQQRRPVDGLGRLLLGGPVPSHGVGL